MQTSRSYNLPTLKAVHRFKACPLPKILFYFLNGQSPASFSYIFGLFQTSINTILQQINVKKCPSSIWHRDSNPRPSERESSPITTRPGLPPIILFVAAFVVVGSSSSRNGLVRFLTLDQCY